MNEKQSLYIRINPRKDFVSRHHHVLANGIVFYIRTSTQQRLDLDTAVVRWNENLAWFLYSEMLDRMKRRRSTR